MFFVFAYSTNKIVKAISIKVSHNLDIITITAAYETGIIIGKRTAKTDSLTPIPEGANKARIPIVPASTYALVRNK